MHVEGRDKVVKFFQYFTKACSWYYLKQNAELSVTYFSVSGKQHQPNQLIAKPL